MNVDFLVPTTTKTTNWTVAEDTHLYRIFVNSLSIHRPDFINAIYLGYDEDDEIWSKQSERDKINKFPFDFRWRAVKTDRGNVVSVWNYLASVSDAEYLFICGDDIKFPNDKNWLTLFIKILKGQNNFGWSAGWSNNDQIATQFLIHRKHVDYFGWVYPPSLRNYYCDDFMFNVYPTSCRGWRKDYPLLNCGGTPRYTPENDKILCEKLVHRHSKTLLKTINK
mgnify:FL=1|tara:strand:- start:105 stop:773 length:669 start_codon:yes stop_codon:yes gene_type:complete